MTKQRIQIGIENSGTGDTLRAAMIKINNNFDELYDLQGQDSSGQGIDINGNTITSNFEDLLIKNSLIFSFLSKCEAIIILISTSCQKH